MMNTAANDQWQAVCASKDLSPGIGVRALVDGKQVAIFRVKDAIYAIDAIDPFSHAAVLARGLIGSIGDRPVVTSPLYKQHFDLRTGECLEDESVRVRVYPVREKDGVVEVTAQAEGHERQVVAPEAVAV